MTKLTGYFGLTALVLILCGSAGPLGAQEGSPGSGGAASANDQIQSAGQRLFKALADGDLAVIGQNTVVKYIRRLTAAKLRPPLTGPKLKASFDGTVTVLRNGPKDAVVEAKIFTPESSNDVPVSEVSRVRLFLVQEGGDWKLSAANKKQAQADADLNGGWYHGAFFTLCPNKGLIFVPNHFSRELQCEWVAQCVEL
jgi:hypothetical protein